MLLNGKTDDLLGWKTVITEMTVWAKACAGIHGSSHFLRVHLLRFSKLLSHEILEYWSEAVSLNSQCNLLWQWKLTHLKILRIFFFKESCLWWGLGELSNFCASDKAIWILEIVFHFPSAMFFFLLLLVTLNYMTFFIICPSISVQLTASKIAFCWSKIGTPVTKGKCVLPSHVFLL